MHKRKAKVKERKHRFKFQLQYSGCGVSRDIFFSFFFNFFLMRKKWGLEWSKAGLKDGVFAPASYGFVLPHPRLALTIKFSCLIPTSWGPKKSYPTL